MLTSKKEINKELRCLCSADAGLRDGAIRRWGTCEVLIGAGDQELRCLCSEC